MRKISFRLKITLWFSLMIVIIIALTYGIIFFISNSIVQKSIQNDLMMIVENNVDEIEFFDSAKVSENYDSKALYIPFGDSYLEIDDDFLDSINNIYTSLYYEDGTFLYGENPISANVNDTKFTNCTLQKQFQNGKSWYVYDRQLTNTELSGLWLRGVVSTERENTQFANIIHISAFLVPALLCLAFFGSYFIAGRSLKPINKIISTVSQINMGQDLQKRINLGSGNDEIHKLANAFDTMFDRLDDSFKKERQFTSDASHELRTPMSVIMAQCEYTLDEDRTPQEYRDALRVIRRQGRKMTMLIDDLLTFTRLERKSAFYEMSRIDFSALTECVCRDMALLETSGIKLRYDIEPNIFINGNASLLTRLITNLISNAYRYGKQDGYIFVKLTSENTAFILSVEDNGIGISDSDKQKIFDRFYQSDTSRSTDGTGLGLAVVQEIARIHEGSVYVESTPDIGSIFCFTAEKFS